MSPFWIIGADDEIMETVVTTGAIGHAKLHIVTINKPTHDECPSCHRTNSVRALKQVQKVTVVHM